MSEHFLRHEGLVQRQEHRDFIRLHLPGASQGCVVEDLDMVQRVYGASYGLDDSGRVRLVELKYGSAGLTGGQIRTFGLLDALLRLGDPTGKRYDGFYLVQTSGRWEDASTTFRVNRQPLDRADFKLWLDFQFPVVPYLFRFKKAAA